MAQAQNRAHLTPAVLYILLSLASAERHGYGIMKQVQIDSLGKIKMGPGTLYGSLNRMMEAGLVTESAKKVDSILDDERRIYYKITALGENALRAEITRYQEVLQVATQNKLLPNLFGHGY